MVAVGCKRAALNQEIEMLHSQIHQQLPMKNVIFVLVVLPQLKKREGFPCTSHTLLNHCPKSHF